MSDEEFWGLTFLEAHWLMEQYTRRLEREQRPLALLLWHFVNVHRNPERQREPFSWDEVRTWLGYAPLPEPDEVPEPEDPVERMSAFVEYWNQIPDGPRPAGMPPPDVRNGTG